MGELVWWWAFAVLAAVVVFLLAAAFVRTDTGQEGPGVKGFVEDVRAGLRSIFHRGGESEVPRVKRSATGKENSDLDSFLAATQVDSPAYVDAGQITETLVNARDRAARTLHVHRISRPDVEESSPDDVAAAGAVGPPGSAAAAASTVVRRPTAEGSTAAPEKSTVAQAKTTSSREAPATVPEKGKGPSVREIAPERTDSELVVDHATVPPWFSREPLPSTSIPVVFAPVHPHPASSRQIDGSVRQDDPDERAGRDHVA